MAWLFALILTLPFMMAAWSLNAWVFYILWDWFAVPLLGVALTFQEAFAISLTIGFVTHQYVPHGDKHGQLMSFLFVRPFLALGIGWVIKQYM